ncbi:hypothetical protein ZIOFF_007211 [Zingiber officinale]|uniref:C3H1-type domain-containing protein n=1 Tax=Zingiber officinale TaxID=94328 RepID=A0A8J5IFS6_ZINOF|nr:hypothetical protein ZIOFF_007211 [Zingiber officinale]
MFVLVPDVGSFGQILALENVLLVNSLLCSKGLLWLYYTLKKHFGESSSAYDALNMLPDCHDKESSFTEDVSPVRLSPGDAVCAEGVHAPNFVIQDMQGASLVPFQLIQGYASDNSEEKDEIDVTSVRTSSLAGLPNIHTDNKIEFKFASPSILSQRTTKDARQDSSEPKLDEFGRLVRGGGVSDGDSDDMQYKDKHGNRCGSSSHCYSPLKSFRHNNKFSRRDKEEHSECFNFVQGRCICGASCHFLHPDKGGDRVGVVDPSRQFSTFNVHGHASDLETDNSARKKGRQEFDKLLQEEIYTKPTELNVSTAKYTVSPGSVRENGQSREVNDDVKQEDTDQHFFDRSPQLDTQHVGKLSETFDPSGGDGEEILIESDSSKQVKNITFQSSPSALFKKFDNNPLGQNEQVPQQSPSNKSYEKQVAAISDEFLHQKGVKVAKSFGPDSSELIQLKSLVQGHIPFINPTNNVSPPLASQQSAPSLIAASVSQSSLQNQMACFIVNIK